MGVIFWSLVLCVRGFYIEGRIGTRIGKISEIWEILCVKYDFNYPDDKRIEFAKAVKELVASKVKFPDWNNREDIQKIVSGKPEF